MKKFSLKVCLYLIALLIVAAMLWLGFWQLSRAEQKQTIQNFVYEQQTSQVNLEEKLIDSSLLYQQGIGNGEFIDKHAILIDNQVSEGRVGYHVVAPFRFAGSKQIVLVNMGWVSAGQSRSSKPEIELPENNLDISGRLQNPHAKPPIWKDDTFLVQDGAWQFLSIEEFMIRSDLQVAPLILELNQSVENPGDYVRQWHEYDDTWINRHKAYALQWFSMAVAFILMCLMLEFRSRKKPVSNS